MKFLLDVPFVMSVAHWIWGSSGVIIADDDSANNDYFSPELCVSTLPLMNAACWNRFVAKGLGVAMILGACLVKAPVLYNIWKARSTAGLSRFAAYGEAVVYANTYLYGYLEGHPFTAYGENGAILLQSMGIISLIWHLNSKTISQEERSAVAVAGAAYVAVILMLLPAEYRTVLQAANWPVYFYARGTQITETYNLRHTGTQSVVTTGMNLFGSAVRIFTTLSEVGWDFAVLTSYGLGVALNLVMFVQYFWYKSNTEKFLKERLNSIAKTDVDNDDDGEKIKKKKE